MTDAHGRVTSEIFYSNTTYFKYDKNGNLLQQPPATYDNKINPYVLSSMWQLENLDYSINNVLDNFTITYNEYGLPVKYVRRGNRFTKFGIECDSLEIVYDCDAPKKGL
jgi:hypothetical protein